MARTRQLVLSSLRGLSRAVGMVMIVTVLATPAFALLPGTIKTPPPTGTSPGTGTGPHGGGVPEIDPNSALGALTLLTGGMLILGGRRRQ
jgi:hypothetical protein